MKRILVLGLLSVLVAITLAGCSLLGASVKKDDKKEVEKTTQSDNKKSPGAAEEAASGIKKDSGMYVGRIDSNFIEIKISGVPEGKSARSFMLSDELKEGFEKLGLKEGGQVGFSYRANDKGQMVLTEIKKL